jgi:phosphodiesterase/alkaline phosphatase D-like protein
MKTSRIAILLSCLTSLIGLFSSPGTLCALTFTGPELIARPTDTSVTVHVVADTAMQAFFEYGTAPGAYSGQTNIIASAGNEPVKTVIDGLSPNTQYYYRMVYSTDSGSTWTNRPEHSFYTQRAPGSSFTFTIITDSHMSGGTGSVSLYQQTLTNANNDHPDFHFDLGDTFWMDGVTSSTTAN